MVFPSVIEVINEVEQFVSRCAREMSQCRAESPCSPTSSVRRRRRQCSGDRAGLNPVRRDHREVRLPGLLPRNAMDTGRGRLRRRSTGRFPSTAGAKRRSGSCSTSTGKRRKLHTGECETVARKSQRLWPRHSATSVGAGTTCAGACVHTVKGPRRRPGIGIQNAAHTERCPAERRLFAIDAATFGPRDTYVQSSGDGTRPRDRRWRTSVPRRE